MLTAWYRGEELAMQNEITLIDRGRGLQLSTSRITVHDLVPYFQQGCSYDEIICSIPSLSHEEIGVVERYYRQHKDELDEYEHRVMAYRGQKSENNEAVSRNGRRTTTSGLLD
jgi:uncharacterized protein (DUF433 family)